MVIPMPMLSLIGTLLYFFEKVQAHLARAYLTFSDCIPILDNHTDNDDNDEDADDSGCTKMNFSAARKSASTISSGRLGTSNWGGLDSACQTDFARSSMPDHGERACQWAVRARRKAIWAQLGPNLDPTWTQLGPICRSISVFA